MKDLSKVTKAMQDLLTANENLQNFDITRNEYVNSDPGRDQWIGIYKGAVKYDPQTLGRGAQNFKVSFTIKVVVQSSGPVHIVDTDELIEKRISFVMDAVNADRTIRSTVLMVVGYDVEYKYVEDDDLNYLFQNAIINIQMEARA